MTKPPTTSTPPLRVAAYCRIDATGEEQIQLLENQRSFYAELINANSDWRMTGVFVDNGSSRSPRPEFQKMLRKCRQKKIDLILTPSLSRFSRNTAYCLNIVGELQELGIAVIFEKENINTMDPDCNVIMSLMGAFARMECDSIPQNSCHMHYMSPVGRPAKGTVRKTIQLPGRPKKTITVRLE